MSMNDVISVNFYIVQVCKTKIVVPFIYSSFTLISTLIFDFQHLHFKNKILSRIANIYDGYWHKLTKVVQNVADIVGKITSVSLIVWQNITWLDFQKIQNFIYIQTSDRPNFKKTWKETYIYFYTKRGEEAGS